MTSPVKPVNRSVVRYKLFPPILPLLLMMTSSCINSGSSVSLSTIFKYLVTCALTSHRQTLSKRCVHLYKALRQQKKGQRPKHGTLEIEKEVGSTTSARPSKSSTLEDLFSKCTGRRSNDSEEVSLSPLRIPPGHSAGSPTVELYRIARHERPSRLRYINAEGELDYYIPTKADLESPRRLELLCQRLREIDLISESPRETGGEIRRGSSFSKPDLLVELAGLTTATEKTGSGKLFFLKGCFCFTWGRTQASSSSSSTAQERRGEKLKHWKSGCFSFLWARKCADKGELEDELTDMEISSPKMSGDIPSAKSSGRLREATRAMHPKVSSCFPFHFPWGKSKTD
ncbi:hypothetical protein LguiA_001994 [Lonicera macranthoides]